jgi:hypothetical protein
MKYSFTPTAEFIPEWNGNRELPDEEQIKMTVSVLSMGDLLNLMDVMEQGGNTGEVDSDQLDMGTTKALVEMATELLPKYITDFRGLEVDDGPIDIATMSGFPQFINLIVEITFELISRSTPNEEDTKN